VPFSPLLPKFREQPVLTIQLCSLFLLYRGSKPASSWLQANSSQPEPAPSHLQATLEPTPSLLEGVGNTIQHLLKCVEIVLECVEGVLRRFQQKMSTNNQKTTKIQQ
jgi:hypothetical protein